ncbi:hypothetical protein LSH36_94g03002 [Paralvinella palmiformis]|uniref:Uncharacterized protein n=1 Tax=Paralvinella palmiformis TaxID=53620 RepID=A0AAD9K204_9ANNE|nr:hypothetical protein LSH36_94g03002 [Paralvinella palmiformis]
MTSPLSAKVTSAVSQTNNLVAGLRENYPSVGRRKQHGRESITDRSRSFQVIERGPYVYREVEMKVDVRFVNKQIQFYPWRRQYFDAELTKAECPDCTETDNITIINQYYFEEVARYSGDYEFAFHNTPSTMSNALRAIRELSTEPTEIMTELGQLTTRHTERWQPYLGTAPGTVCFSFGCWLWLNDTADKSAVLDHREGRDFNAEEMNGLYDALTDVDVFGSADRTDEALPIPCSMPDNWTTYRPLLAHQTPVGALAACLEVFARLRTPANEGQLLNITDLVASYLCRNETSSCLDLPTDFRLRLAYVGVISDYVLTNVAGYALFRSLLHGEEFIDTKPQCRWALGACQTADNDTDGSALPRGILDHAPSEEAALATSRHECLLNCYDATFAETNMMWKAYDNKDRASIDQFPKASPEARLIQSRRYNLMPAQNLSACASYDVPGEAYEFFRPEFWRRLSYVRSELTSLGGVKLRRLLFNRSNLDTDNVFVFEQGIQDMSGTYNFSCSVCLPHFLYAGDSIRELYSAKPEEQCHRPYVDIEPVTGEVWRQIWRYQFNIGISQRYISAPRIRSLQVNHTDIPTPAYWLEQSFSYTERGRQDYHERASSPPIML